MSQKIKILSTKKLPLLNEEAAAKLRSILVDLRDNPPLHHTTANPKLQQAIDVVGDLGKYLRWLNLYETLYDNNGKQGKWALASRNRDGDNNAIPVANAVVTVPVLVTPEGERKLVLIKEFRIPIQTHEYHFVAGLLEAGESIEECVKRELKEEAGLDLLKITRISPRLPSSAGMTDESAVMAFADCTFGDGKQELEENEDIEVILLNHAEVCEWAKKPLLYAAKTWPVLLMYEQMGSLKMR